MSSSFLFSKISGNELKLPSWSWRDSTVIKQTGQILFLFTSLVHDKNIIMSNLDLFYFVVLIFAKIGHTVCKTITFENGFTTSWVHEFHSKFVLLYNVACVSSWSWLLYATDEAPLHEFLLRCDFLLLESSLTEKIVVGRNSNWVLFTLILTWSRSKLNAFLVTFHIIT